MIEDEILSPTHILDRSSRRGAIRGPKDLANTSKRATSRRYLSNRKVVTRRSSQDRLGEESDLNYIEEASNDHHPPNDIDDTSRRKYKAKAKANTCAQGLPRYYVARNTKPCPRRRWHQWE